MGERTALNYVQRMSGVATETRKYADAISGFKAKIVDTRKTTPNFRAFEKYSVKVGGGALHRFNLSDCAMIKDNHIRLAGSITEAVRKLRENISHAHKIEVECDTIEQVKEALTTDADIIMLDNMDTNTMTEACKLINHQAIIEASGNVNLDTVESIAKDFETATLQDSSRFDRIRAWCPHDRHAQGHRQCDRNPQGSPPEVQQRTSIHHYQ